MYILVTYDIATTTADGARRLRRAAKACLDHGQRVQYSVFECKVDPAQYVAFKDKLTKILEPETDCVRFYNLGNNWNERVEHIGCKKPYDIEGPLII